MEPIHCPFVLFDIYFFPHIKKSLKFTVTKGFRIYLPTGSQNPQPFSMRRDVFQAIADPTRREIINLVAHQSLNLNAVAENFNISRPAISKHIKILTECGLIIIRQQGRERFCQADLRPLSQVSGWIEQYRTFWTSKLDALGEFLNQATNKPPKRKTTKKTPGKR
jgi:DNA-binding transcriptional ArsR family regulator